MRMDQEKILYNEIGKKIKKRRKELGITQDRLAELTNYSFSFIANIESSTYQSFSISALHTIAKVLEVPMKDLLPDEILLNTDVKKIKCEYCNFYTELPIEITKLLTNIENITLKPLYFTCPKCQKKIK